MDSEVYAIDSQGNVGTSSIWTDTKTLLTSPATWAQSMDSIGIRNRIGASAHSSYCLDNIYFSTDGACTATLPTPFVTPEPTMIALFGVGSLIFIRRK
jgi:hypothetical protein